MKNKKVILSILFGLICIAVWFYFIDIDEMLNYIRDLKLTFLLVATFFYLLSYFIRSLRWKIILSPNVNLKVSITFLYWMAGNFLNYLIPIRAGELAKSLFIKRNYKTPISVTLPSVFIDKMFDSIAIFVVILLIPFLNVNVSKPLLILLLILVIIVLISILILVFSAVAKNKVVNFLHKILFFLPRKHEEKIYSLIDTFIEGVGLFKNHLQLLPVVVFLTLLAVAIDSIYFSFMFLAFGQKINFFIILFGYTLIYLSYILPQPPAQIGSNEIIMVVIFSVGLGLNTEMVSAVMAIAHILTGSIITIIGILSLSFSGFSLLDFNRNKDIDQF